MTTTTRILVLMTGLSLCVVSEARAQLSNVFVNVNAAVQTQSHDAETSASFPLYLETATVQATQKIHSAAMFDIGGGYRVWHNLYAALAVSRFSDESTADITATIPHPFFNNRPVTVNPTWPGLKHTEVGIHPQAVWLVPITDKIDVAFSAGPSFFKVKQALVTTVTVQPNTQTVTGVVVDTQKKTAVGANVGVDFTYLFTKRLGGGLFMRYAGASVDLPSVENLKVGGFQLGIGARVRY